MKIEYRTGNLLEAEERIIVQGCNAQGVMGKGLAKEIKARMPGVFAVYRAAYDMKGLHLGEIIWAKDGDPDRPDEGKVVANAITQNQYRQDPNEPTVHADYDAIRQVVRGIDRIAQMSNGASSEAADRYLGAEVGPIQRVGFPLIGAGLAGGSWRRIAAIIEEESKHFSPVVYLIDGKVPTT